jgi:hypothetical protein
MPEAILEPQTRLEIASGLFHPQASSRVGKPILVHEPRSHKGLLCVTSVFSVSLWLKNG